MARPTNIEPKDGEAGREKGDDVSVPVQSKHTSSGPEASGKDAEDAQEGSTSSPEDSKDSTAETRRGNGSKDGGSASDNDTGERPVREKLRETSIAGIPNAPIERPRSPDDMSMASEKSPSAAGEASDTSSAAGSGKSKKKRSFDDVQPEDQDADSNDDDTAHRRKRSRESTPGDSAAAGENHAKSDIDANDNHDVPEKSMETKVEDDSIATATDEVKKTDGNALERIMSPKKKRSRDQFDIDLKEEVAAEKNQDGKTKGQVAPDNSEISSDNVRRGKGEPEKKRHRDNSQERDTTAEPDIATAKIPSTNAFSNSSAVSPFASLVSPKSPASSEKPSQTTSSSAFASSGLAAFAGSEKSPFSSLGGSTPPASGFGSAAAADSNKTEATGFAGAAAPGASPFASTGTSGFGKLGAGFGGSSFGGGFAAATQTGGGLTSFAASTGPAPLGSGSSKAKPFGAPADANEEKGEDKDEKPGFEGLEDEKEDDRFFKQQTETGEEGEETDFSCKAKLFHFDGKEWKERGLGTFKLNITRGSGEDPKVTARLIMRADGALRVILNTPVFKGMTVGDASGEEPSTKHIHLASLENGRSVPLLLRTGSIDLTKGLYNKIEAVKKIL